MKKYYIEIWRNDMEFEQPYALQSQWYDTKEQAFEWATTLDYLDPNFSISLMASEWDEINDCPIDIDFLSNITYGKELIEDTQYVGKNNRTCYFHASKVCEIKTRIGDKIK